MGGANMPLVFVFFFLLIMYHKYKHNCHPMGSLGVLLLDTMFTIRPNWGKVT